MQVRSSVAVSINSKINFKIIVVGERGVGKTSLILRYVKGTYQKNYSVTVGVEFYSKVLEIKEEEIALQIWDTAGQESFKSMVRSFYHLAGCIVITYCQAEDMIKNIDEYILQINEHAHQGARIMLIRTKTDQFEVTENEREIANQLIKKHNIDIFMEVSAKEDLQINQFFQAVAEKLYDCYQNDEEFKELIAPVKNSFKLQSNITENPGPQKPSKKKCCQ